MPARTIVFGDIHGCHREWADLLDRLSPGTDDALIAVGDIVGKGPSTTAALDFARSLQNFRSIIGNHELRQLRRWRRRERPVRTADLQFSADVGSREEELLTWIASWPLWIEERDFLIVHAGLRPGKRLEEQSVDDLVNLRTLEDGRPWYEAYEGEKLALYGHWAMAGLVVRDQTIGLDTGCVYGGRLTACVLPERRIESVPARERYVVPTAP